MKERPAALTEGAEGAAQVVSLTQMAAKSIHLNWRNSNYLLLRRGPYVVAAGLDESIGRAARSLHGRFVNLFDSSLRVQNDIGLAPRSRWLLLDVDSAHSGKPHLLAAACKAVNTEHARDHLTFAVQGVGETPGVMLLESPKSPRAVTLEGKELTSFEYSARERLLWIHFQNDASLRTLTVGY